MLRLPLVAEVQGGERLLHLDQLHDVQQVGTGAAQTAQQLVQVLGLDLREEQSGSNGAISLSFATRKRNRR